MSQDKAGSGAELGQALAYLFRFLAVQGKSGIEGQIKSNVYILVPGRPQLRIQEIFDRLGVLHFALKLNTQLTAFCGFVFALDADLFLRPGH